MWDGFVPNQDLPYVINPDAGYLVSSNNFVTSSNVKHGVSHSFGFTHRAQRVTEMIEETLLKGNKFDSTRMKQMQVDLVDIQARESLKDMIECVMSGHKGRDIGRALQILKTWDFRFSLDSTAATLFSAWEH